MSKRIALRPVAGFVVKTVNEEPGVYAPTPNASPNASSSSKMLEPALKSTAVTKGFKIFVNIAYEPAIPPPPYASEAEVKRAMVGENMQYFVPVVVSDGREMLDKGSSHNTAYQSDLCTRFQTSLSHLKPSHSWETIACLRCRL